MVPPAKADNPHFVTEIVNLVNLVFADGEKGLWQEGASRTDDEGVTSIVRAGQLIVASFAGRTVGAVRVQRLDDIHGEIGMLVASPDHRGAGIGRELLAFAERWAWQQGLIRMQLRLLVPQTWTHPVKEFLRGWYTSTGYRRVRIGRLEEAYPMLQPQLATPCDFVIYQKDLSTRWSGEPASQEVETRSKGKGSRRAI